MLTHGKLLLVEYRVEQEKWDRRFGFIEVEHGVLSTPYIYIYIYIYILDVVRFSTVCISRHRWPHQFDIGIKEMPPTTIPETVDGCLRGVDRCGQTGFSQRRWINEQA